MDFGKKIQTLRKNNNLSQEKLAAILKVNRNCLSRIETGKSEPSLSMIKSVVEYFKIDVGTLIGIKTDDSSSKEKIDKITSECSYLLDDDLDFLIRIISVMREEYVKKN